MLIRQMTDADILIVVAIEQAVQVSPWTQEMFVSGLAHHDRGWVLIDEGILCGYIFVKPQQNEADILTLAVDKHRQGKGYAQALMQFVLRQFECLYLEVRVSNHRAIGLYEKMGFKIVGKRPQYYKTEDAWVMKATAVKTDRY